MMSQKERNKRGEGREEGKEGAIAKLINKKGKGPTMVCQETSTELDLPLDDVTEEKKEARGGG